VTPADRDLDVVQLVVGAALATLEASRRRIDDLNVYPVPDGDTGTNLTMTVRAVAQAVDESHASDRQSLARDVARGALMGARGNSGVILSQIVRGAADVLAQSTNGVDAPLAARALRGATDAAYRAVRRPVEGTMLSVIRELAEEAEQRADGRSPLGDLLVELVRRGEDAVARTPEQLDVLREAGVVDAGGAGLLELVRGVASAVSGERVPEAPAAEEHPGVEAIHQELSRYRYCTVFVIEGEQLDRDQLENALELLGDSLLVVGDESALKVHVHTDEPGAALSLGTAVGAIDQVEIANMHEQTQRREERLLAAVPDAPPALPTTLPATERAQTGVVAVVAGAGNRRLFESLAAPVGPIRVVEGGQTMNPSTADLLDALRSLEAEEAILLPNNSNVLLAAEQAALHAERPVEVVPADSIPAGLAAMVVFDGSRSAAENAVEMRGAVASVATGEVTIASRDVGMNGLAIRRGEWLGLADGDPVAGGTDFADVALAVVERLLAEPRELLTLLVGAEPPPLGGLLERIAAAHPDVEVEVQEGGQAHYPLLLSAE
jgi:DAK2 domain fusion protein YloV